MIAGVFGDSEETSYYLKNGMIKQPSSLKVIRDSALTNYLLASFDLILPTFGG